jgi:hypothetical protein
LKKVIDPTMSDRRQGKERKHHAEVRVERSGAGSDRHPGVGLRSARLECRGHPRSRRDHQSLDARLATAKYAMDLDRPKADGYTIITQMIPDKAYTGFTSRNKGRGR